MSEWEEQTGVLEFRGPDAVRFLNGQVTQDVRKVSADGIAIPSCVTDAKGRLQFRIWIVQRREDQALLIFSPKDLLENLEARLTRYLIADDVEVCDVSGEVNPQEYEFPGLRLSELERIEQGIPKWGAELTEGMLPPEAGLDITDISYNKGCYIGQEVISRIKSAGKVNRRLVKFGFDGDGKIGDFVNTEGKVCGEVTSVSGSIGLGYLKRSAEGEIEFQIDGVRFCLR
jgi:folate-binding protein YgfZ